MNQWSLTASRLFRGANRFLEAYHAALQPVCRATGLPPMAVDILMFFANNPESSTAGDLCRCRGLKSGIVSVHIDRLVNDGLLMRQSVPEDRRKTRLVCTKAAGGTIETGRALQRRFAQQLLEGLSEEEIRIFHSCLSVLSQNIDDIRKNGIAQEDRSET